MSGVRDTTDSGEGSSHVSEVPADRGGMLRGGAGDGAGEACGIRAAASQAEGRPETVTYPADDIPGGCECGNTHQAVGTVCRRRRTRGRRNRNDPEVVGPAADRPGFPPGLLLDPMLSFRSPSQAVREREVVETVVIGNVRHLMTRRGRCWMDLHSRDFPDPSEAYQAVLRLQPPPLSVPGVPAPRSMERRPRCGRHTDPGHIEDTEEPCARCPAPARAAYEAYRPAETARQSQRDAVRRLPPVGGSAGKPEVAELPRPFPAVRRRSAVRHLLFGLSTAAVLAAAVHHRALPEAVSAWLRAWPGLP